MHKPSRLIPELNDTLCGVWTKLALLTIWIKNKNFVIEKTFADRKVDFIRYVADRQSFCAYTSIALN
jgi:hypothetical protein